jgi:subtilisin-like proprotein convertase family protein
MKKFTLLIALFVSAIVFGQNTINADAPTRVQKQVVTNVKQQGPSTFTSTTNTGRTSIFNDPAGSTTLGTKGANDVIVITHSNTQTIEDGAEIACANAVAFRDNWMYRDFDLAGDFGVTDDFTTIAAEVAIGPVITTPTGFPLTVNIWSADTGTFPGGALTLEGTGSVTITNADAQTIVSVPVVATIAAGKSMILQIQILDDGTETNFMRFGCNNDGETGPSYIQAPVCGAADPTPFGDLGLSQALVANVLGEVGGDGPGEPDVFITHSDSQTVNPGGSVACGSSAAGYTTENAYFRDFDLAQDFGIFNEFEVMQAEFGMQTVGAANHPVTVNVYSLSGSAPLSSSFGEAVLQGTANYNVNPTDEGTVVNVPVSAMIPAGDRLVFEVFLSSGVDIPAQFRIGVNDLGQTDATYLASASCGLPDPLDVAAIGFPDMHVVMNILGTEILPQCDITSSEADGLPMDIDGEGTSTADCDEEPNLVPVTVTGINTLGENAFIDNVSLSLTHTYTGDLTLSLVSPSGTELVLSEQNGGSGDNYVGTIFKDGGTPITEGSAPFTGVFAPEGAGGFSVFDGEFSAGEWNLKVCDAFGGDSGSIITFSMDICNFEVINNDVCEDAFEVTCGDTVMGNTNTILNTNTGGNSAPDSWYSYVGASERELVTISLCGDGTDFDTVLRVYDACDGTEIATNDDSCGVASELRFTSDGTTTYYIMVEGFGSASGNYEMNVSCEAPAANDLFADAIEVFCDDSVMGSTLNATFDDVGECGTSNTAPGVWYYLRDDSLLEGNIDIATCSDNTDYDTKLSVFTVSAEGLVCVTGNDDDCPGFQSAVNFPTDGNTTFLVLVHGFSSGVGNFELTVGCNRTPPANDDIANAYPPSPDWECPGSIVDENVALPAATTEGGNPVDCNIDGANGVWYGGVSPIDATITVTIESPAGASFVTAYTADEYPATEEDLTLLDGVQCVPGSTLTYETLEGQVVYIFVVNSGGRSDVTFTCEPLLGTEENTIEGFSFYPNPANDTVNLSSVDTIDTVVIYNILGQKVIDLNVEATSSQINVSNLNTGTYLMKVSVNGETATYKVIKR